MKKVYLLIFDYVKQHKWSTTFFIVFGIFWATALPYMAYLLGIIIDQIKNHDLNTMPTWQIAGVSMGLYIAVHVLRSIGYYCHAFFMLTSVTSYKSYLINKLFQHLGQQSVAYFERQRSGFISNKITNACISLESIMHNLFTIIFPQLLALLFTGILISTIIPYFGLVLWLWGISIVIFTYRAAKIVMKKQLFLLMLAVASMGKWLM